MNLFFTSFLSLTFMAFIGLLLLPLSSCYKNWAKNSVQLRTSRSFITTAANALSQSPSTDAKPSVAITMSSASSKPKIKKSFYRRKLPLTTCTALSSKEGQKIFKSSLENNGCKSFFQLIEQFTTQSEPAYCGISTLVIVLNALSVDPRQIWKGPWRWYEESMLNCCVSLDVVKETGISLNEFVCLGRCQGLHVEPFLASDVTLDEFREAVVHSCVDDEGGCNNSDCPTKRSSNVFLVTSYTRKVLNQTGDGHFSPIAAYDKDTDKVLILDTARFKYGVHWVDLKLLFDAMKPIDKSTNKSRGFALLSFGGNDDLEASIDSVDNDSTSSHHQQQHLPQTILFQMNNMKNPIRRQYKEFLLKKVDEKHVSFEEVVLFWTKDGKDFSLIWQAIKPQKSMGSGGSCSSTCQRQEDAVIEKNGNTSINNNDSDYTNFGAKKLREDLLVLIRQLMPSLEQPLSQMTLIDDQSEVDSSCRANVADAIFLMYLASLSVEERNIIVYGDDNDSVGDDDDTAIAVKQQLLAEAHLLTLSLDASYDLLGKIGTDCQGCSSSGKK